MIKCITFTSYKILLSLAACGLQTLAFEEEMLVRGREIAMHGAPASVLDRDQKSRGKNAVSGT